MLRESEHATHDSQLDDFTAKLPGVFTAEQPDIEQPDVFTPKQQDVFTAKLPDIEPPDVFTAEQPDIFTAKLRLTPPVFYPHFGCVLFAPDRSCWGQ